MIVGQDADSLATSIDSLSSSLTVPSSVEVRRNSILRTHRVSSIPCEKRRRGGGGAYMLNTSCFFFVSAIAKCLWKSRYRKRGMKPS